MKEVRVAITGELIDLLVCSTCLVLEFGSVCMCTFARLKSV